jgi:hypothetical protein
MVYRSSCWKLAAALVLAVQAAGCTPSTGPHEEYYESILLAGAKVGWSHTLRQTVVEEGQRLVCTRSRSELSLVRQGQTAHQRIVLACWETPEGKLVRFESDQDDGKQTARGEVRRGKLHITRTTFGNEQTDALPWGDWGGFFAPTDSLRRKPMRPGQRRTVTSLMPLVNIPADTTLEALNDETVELPDGPRRLLKIRGTVALGESELEMHFWVDAEGNVLRTRTPALDQESIRVSKEEALRPAEPAGFDLLVDAVVKLKPPAPDFARVRRLVYRARLKTGRIGGVFSEGASQRVRVIDEKTAEVEVLAARPGIPAEAPPQEPPTTDETQPTTLVQSDDAEVRRMAGAAAADQSDPWTIATALERHIHANLRQKNYSQAFASAAEVARSLEGDCTEHAVLLAACLRARGIPARVAFGLVYVPALEGFAYHMWTEAWIAERWIGLDGTRGRGGIDCDHIQLGHSSLQGAKTYQDIFKVAVVFRQLELSVVAAE